MTLLPRINVDPPVQSKWRRIFFFQVAFRFEKGLGDLFGGEWQRDLRMGSEHVIPIVLTGAETSDAGVESHHLPSEVLPGAVGIEAAVDDTSPEPGVQGASAGWGELRRWRSPKKWGTAKSS